MNKAKLCNKSLVILFWMCSLQTLYTIYIYIKLISYLLVIRCVNKNKTHFIYLHILNSVFREKDFLTLILGY